MALAQGKIEGPSQFIVYLGILIDAGAQIIRLPDQKLHKLKVILHTWLGKAFCTNVNCFR